METDGGLMLAQNEQVPASTQTLRGNPVRITRQRRGTQVRSATVERNGSTI